MADYLLGYVADLQLSNVWVVEQRHWATMFFAQDDWKVNSKLSLNLGLRYDFITPALEASDAQTNFDPSGGGSLLFAGSGSLEDRGLVKPDTNNFAPRVGAVYKMNEKTLIRGGWGIFYNLFDRVGSEDQLALNLPGLVNKTVTQTSGSPVFFLRQGFPPNFLDAAQPRSRGRTAQSRATPCGDQRRAEDDHQSGQLRHAARGAHRHGAQRRLHLHAGLESGVAGQPEPAAAERRRQQRARAFCRIRTSGSSSGARRTGSRPTRALDLGLEKRFSQGYAFGVSYTIGDSKDNTSEQLTTQGSNAFPQNSRDFGPWYGPSDYDVRHRLTTNFVWDLPLGDSVWARDWNVSGVWAWRSGRPFTVNQSSNNVGTNMTGLPNQVGDPQGPETVDQWFNIAAFQAVTSGTFGNELRNRMRGPNWQSVDLTIQRRIRFNDRVAATLRWDIFNLFNTTNLGLPNRNIPNIGATDPTFGTISSLAGDARIMQLAVRLTFSNPDDLRPFRGGTDDPSVPPSRDIPVERPLRVAVIGCGAIAQMMHLPTLAERPDLFTITGLADIDRATLDAVATRYHVTRRATDFNELLSDPQADAVLVLASGGHRKFVLPALAAGKHVFVEKPLGFSVAETREIAAAARRSGRLLMVGYHKRFDPAYLRTVDEVRRLESLRFVDVTVLHPDEDAYRRHHALLPVRSPRRSPKRCWIGWRSTNRDRGAASPARRDSGPRGVRAAPRRAPGAADQPDSRRQRGPRRTRGAGGGVVCAHVAKRHGADVADAICRRRARGDDLDFRARGGPLPGTAALRELGAPGHADVSVAVPSPRTDAALHRTHGRRRPRRGAAHRVVRRSVPLRASSLSRGGARGEDGVTRR